MDTTHDSAAFATEAPSSRWARATEGDREAFRELAGSYWYIAYAWWRRAGLEAEPAATATLAVFARWITEAPPRLTHTGGGRMREWLPARLAELSTQGVELAEDPAIAIEPAWAEERYAEEPEGNPDTIFQRRWALTVLEFTMEAIRAEYVDRGLETLFAEVSPFAGFEGGDEESYTAAANRAGMTVGGMRKAVFDFRTRHRELLRSLVGDTVADPADLDSEITALLCACDAPGATPASMPTVIRQHKPDELLARAMRTVQMSSGGAGQWTPPSDAEIKRLFPQYQMLGMLGRGGMGAVYKARQIELDRLVAIKLLPLEISVDKEFADRFRREARAMAKLNHPNIIAVHDFGTTTEGHLFFAMEYVEGANLADTIHSVGLNEVQTLAIAEQVCTALAYAHGKGIVHRDIKPANVMISTEGQVKVADFGLARLTDPSAEQMGQTMTGTVMGTPDYMAPEQMRGMNVDHRADIYSLGVMLYEMLCKEVPKGIFDPPSHRTGCDARIDQIVIKAMNSSPDRRYQSTEELKAAVVAARTPATMVVSGATQVVHPQPVAKGALAAPKGAVMQTIAPPAVKKGSKVPLYAGLVVGLVAVIGGGAFFLTKPKSERTNPNVDKVGAATTATAPLEPGAIRLWDSPEKIPAKPGISWKDGALHLDSTKPGYVTPHFKTPPSRDVILRASIRLNPDAAGQTMSVRARTDAANASYRYTLNFTSDAKLLLRAFSGTGGVRVLQQWPLPRSLGADEWIQLELRAIGNEVTVSADGHVVGSVRDDSVPEPGGLEVYATTNGYFRDIVYVPLDKASSTVGAASSAGVWQPLFTDAEWRQDTYYGELKDGLKHLKSKQWTKPQASSDGAIRARFEFREDTRNPSVVARASKVQGQTGQDHYKLQLSNPAAFVDLNFTPAGGASESIARVPIPKPPQTGEKVELELRVEGDRLIGKWNGAVVIDARDSRVKGPGEWGINANDGWYEAVEVQELPDARVPSAAAPPSAATKDAPFVNSLGMKFVPVPITSGPTNGKRVLFSVWETRVQDYEVFAAETKRRVSPVAFPQGPTHPAVSVSWDDAQAFCAWLTTRDRQAGKISVMEGYRLPSDHEWSCAVGLGAQEDGALPPEAKDEQLRHLYPWGTQWPPPPGVGNFAGEEVPRLIGKPPVAELPAFIAGYRDDFPATAPVGSFPANALGLHDLSGNVYEWVQDQWRSGLQRVVRGGSWADSNEGGLYSAHRAHSLPESRFGHYGFRIILAPDPVAESSTPTPAGATKAAPFVNTLGMKFVPVPITGGPTDGQRVLFSVWETRVQDYEAFSKRERSKSGFDQGPMHPAVDVRWGEATAFCAWLTERERKAGKLPANERYRLPSDHEWSCAVGIGAQEDAAKTPEEKSEKLADVFPWGRDWPPPAGAGNFLGEENRAEGAPGASDKRGIPPGYTDGYQRTAPVGSFAVNPLGLYDLSGNVAEWCEDWTDEKKEKRVARGGAWDYTPRTHLLSSKRGNLPADKTNGGIGFRVVLATSSPASAESAPAKPTPATPNPVAATPAPAMPATSPARAPVAAQTPTGQWLAEQEPQWQAAFAKEVSAPFEKGVGDLNKQYLAVLETQFGAATKAGKLDEAVAFRAERERMTGGGAVPAEDEALAPAVLKGLRATYRAAFAKLDTERVTKAKGVHARYDTILAQSQAALTQRGRLDEALEIKTQREALHAAWLKPQVAPSAPTATAATPAPATSKPASGAATTPPPSKTPKLKPRELVERLLAMGALIDVVIPGAAPIRVEKISELPGDKFVINNVKFPNPRAGLTAADLDILEQLGDVADLDLNGLPANDTTIEKLRRLPKLRSLILRKPNNLTEAGFKAIAELPVLQALDINVPLTTDCLVALGQARQLSRLSLFGTSFTEQDFAALAAIPAPASLTLVTNQSPPPAAWARLSSAKNLVELQLGQVPTSAAMIGEISKLAGLETLTLGRITFTDAEFAPLGALKSLQRLRTGKDSTLDGSVFATWPLRPNMKSLSLISQRSVNDDALRAIAAAFPKLERLDVTADAESVTAAGFAHLTKLKQLGFLDVTGDALDDEGLAHLAKCDLLYYLGLGKARVTEAGVQSLPKLSALRDLNWINPPVTETAIKSYGKLRSLTQFRIGPETTPEIEQKLKAALPKVKVVR